jgi:Putative MetA-pathway of phenol degradation
MRIPGFLVVCLFTASAALAQQRPLVTEDPETIGGGRILTEFGFEHGWDQFFPASGLTGDLLRVPIVGVSVGLSSIAELQVDWGFYQRLAITNREPAPLAFKLEVDDDETSDVEDMVIATKLRFVSERGARPAFALRLGTKLPNASNESGLGLDTTDFFATLLVGRTAGSTRYVGNIGLGIFGDPLRGDRQSDMLLYGFSIAHALHEGFEVVGEINGRFQWAEEFPTPGAESRAVFRGGVRYTVGAGRIDGGLLFGATSRDPGIGIMFGYTHVFEAFSAP